MTDCTVFDGNDMAYLRWLREHPDGYVCNTRRQPDPDYMVLHRANCRTIDANHSSHNPGAFTERDYIKVCATSRAALQSWVRSHGRRDGTFSKECSRCA